MRISRFIIGCLSLCLVACCATARADDRLTFEQHIRPILKAYCLDCHGGGEKLEGSLDLRLRRFAVKGGETGPAIVAGDSAHSLLLERMKSGEMPVGEKKVPPEKIALIEQWIASGAATADAEPEQLPPGIDITAAERAHWSFQPIQRVDPPATPAGLSTSNTRTPIDAFVLARLSGHAPAFAPDADRLTLIRRVALDLTGLPPTQPEIDQFLADTTDGAYEALLDRYLASPQYGERWARHWLDVAGYAESEGDGNVDTPRPYAYKYRDYVIRSLNADKPLDQFVIEQLAGDELVPQPWSNLTPAQIEQLVATGFLRMAADPTASGGVDEATGANQAVADTLKIVGSSLLGLSVGCAQCHDHRYDPIPQVDYYRMRAIFEPALDPSKWRRSGQRMVSLYTDVDRAKAAAVDAEAQAMQTEYNTKLAKVIAAVLEKVLLKFPEAEREPLRVAYNTPGDKRSAEQKKLLDASPKVNIHPGVIYQYDEPADKDLKADQARLAAKRVEKPVEDFIGVLNEIPGQLPETHLFHRGDHRQPKGLTKPGDLTIAAPSGQRFEIADKDPLLASSGRRLAFAKHLMSGSHPLVGRVLANRIWLNHFGRGLVDTPGDFGALGTKPSHPELLDWLATELPRQGWSLKRMHKLIMTSTVYRQSSRRDPAVAGDDAENRFYSRFPLRRLDAEVLRDRILLASGKLDRAQFGPAVKAVEDFFGQVVAENDLPRRSVYLEVRRTKPMSFLTTFDAPVMAVNCDRRVGSTGAPQSLMLMNSEFVLKHAGLLAQRTRAETPVDFAAELAKSSNEKYPQAINAWRYGYGIVDDATRRVTQFTPLAHFTGTTYQGSSALPDPQTGWALLTATGGHAGNDAAHATIRRWTVSRAGVLTISGKLKHPSASGDGVRGRIVSSRHGALGDWGAKTNEVATDIPPTDVQPGDTIDFVVDCRGDVNSDSFEWIVDLKPADPNAGPRESWNSARDFRPDKYATLPQQIAYAWRVAFQRLPAADELDFACQFMASQLEHLRATNSTADLELVALTDLCQQLLSSNEFLYAD